MTASPSPTSGPPPSQGARPAAVAFVLVTIALDVISMGLVIPVLPKLVESLSGGNTAHAASIFGVFGTAWALMQLIFSPLLGSLSDRFGRRPVILLSNLGLGLDYVLCALAPDLVWLFIGRVISGICAATFSTSSAYIADVTPPAQRAQKFGLVGAAFGVGFVLGPALGGILGSADPRLPFWVAAALSLANAAYGYFVLPESLPKENRARFSWAKANPLGALRLLRSNDQLWGLAAVQFLFHVAHAALPAVFVLYSGYRYGWTERDVGISLALVGVCSAIVQGGLIKPVVARIGERAALLAGLAFGIGGFLIYGLAPTGALSLLGIPVMTLWGLASASLSSMMSRLVDSNAQGQLQGASSSLMGIGSLIAPTMFTQSFAWAITGVPASAARWPGAPFLLGAGLLGVALAVAWRVTAPGRHDPGS
jgi:MFS transporter, DHA1 family, tetracycline resistance protein